MKQNCRVEWFRIQGLLLSKSRGTKCAVERSCPVAGIISIGDWQTDECTIWSDGGMILTGGNHRTGEKTVPEPFSRHKFRAQGILTPLKQPPPTACSKTHTNCWVHTVDCGHKCRSTKILPVWDIPLCVWCSKWWTSGRKRVPQLSYFSRTHNELDTSLG